MEDGCGDGGVVVVVQGEYFLDFGVERIQAMGVIIHKYNAFEVLQKCTSVVKWNDKISNYREVIKQYTPSRSRRRERLEYLSFISPHPPSSSMSPHPSQAATDTPHYQANSSPPSANIHLPLAPDC